MHLDQSISLLFQCAQRFSVLPGIIFLSVEHCECGHLKLGYGKTANPGQNVHLRVSCKQDDTVIAQNGRRRRFIVSRYCTVHLGHA